MEIPTTTKGSKQWVHTSTYFPLRHNTSGFSSTWRLSFLFHVSLARVLCALLYLAFFPSLFFPPLFRHLVFRLPMLYTLVLLFLIVIPRL
ncbi:hypothetical protein BDN70DRAFT_58747 [Pholiota conissans]|uniref:Transmembrane protein n=1 Tax=Pholiota conissans TaxID=109636 RepID=A0A9P6CSH5_9AGAR|nr:hypothetical protein BDN70DRAFT_58747 [Pholiota conissans]